jgi:succinate dehydrogenase / fumarate reductase cytochrome b subunit
VADSDNGSETAGGTDKASRKPGFMDRHHFLLRRLHSLTGIVPIGVFLVGHLTTNSTIAWGVLNTRAEAALPPEVVEEVGSTAARQIGTFQHEVAWINESLPFLILIEITLWVSIAFHSILGFYYAMTGRSNTGRYSYQSNWRYTLQRWSGYIGILFIFYHVATLRWGWTWLVPGGVKWSYHESTSTLAMAIRGSETGEWTWMGVFVALLYMVGVTLLVFHFANGLWTAAITWGMTITEKAQRNWGYACFAIGAALMLMGWSALIGFLIVDVEKAQAVEDAMRKDGVERTSLFVPENATAPGLAVVGRWA